LLIFFFFFSSRRRHTRSDRDWSSDVCSSDLGLNFGASIAFVLLTTFVIVAAKAAQAVVARGDSIEGVVTGPNGPESGVWVIAETTDLPTRFAKIVVTDDQGRYVIPQLPKATYDVWVRGYGLVDSPKTKST